MLMADDSPGVFADPGELPGNLHARGASRNAELVTGDFVRDIHRCRAADACQLVAEVLAERLDPGWQVHDRLAMVIENRIAAVDIRLLRGLDAGVCQVFAVRVKRVIDHEVLGPCGERPCHLDVAGEGSGEALAQGRDLEGCGPALRIVDGEHHGGAIAAR